MQAPTNAIITTIPKGRPEHISLDFDRLRAEGIRHLENLATEIWTDFNAHDPGITLLEVLCYAITDLGYRTRMLPIQDLAAGDGTAKPWFEAAEILPMSPVTANDLRKILIDIDGIKNAWVERARIEDLRLKSTAGDPVYLKKNVALRFKTFSVLNENSGVWIINIAAIESFVEKYIPRRIDTNNDGTPDTDNPAFAAAVADIASIASASQWDGQAPKIQAFFNRYDPVFAKDLFCQYAYFHQKTFTLDASSILEGKSEADALHLNGIYRVLLEIDDHLDPASDKIQRRYAAKALQRLHDDRGICQDYLQPEVVQNWCYCLCLDLETDPAANEKEIAAEVLYRIQEFLLPTVRFYTFREMYDRGIPCDQIYNGPLLKHGFIPEAELNASARLPRFIYRSDLLRIASETPGVLDVRDLRLKVPNPGAAYSDDWIVFVLPPHNAYDTGEMPPGNLKPLLDACCSKVNILRGDLPPQVFTGSELDDYYQGLRMSRLSPGSGDPGKPEYPLGVLREDLDDYLSVQYELPAIYGVGQYQAAQAPSFASRQLQAYLLFYDQILAGYLAQLGQVRNLFSIEQNPNDPTAVLPPLFDAPGALELMGDFADLLFPAQAWSAVDQAAQQEMEKLADNVLKLKAKLAAEGDTLSEEVKRQIRSQILSQEARRNDLAQLAAKLQPLTGKTYQGLTALREALASALGNYAADYSPVAVAEVWQAFTADPNNNLVQALDKIADPPARRQDRRNRLLDHLIARFGETFSEYIATLARPDADPEDNPWHQDFAEYLRDKARMLQSVATIGAERGRGFNYRKMNQWKQPDVWNTDNVSGLQKRVCRLLGIESFRSGSLLGMFPYRLDIVPRKSKSGKPAYIVQLMRREETEDKPENPHRTGPLLASKPLSKSQADAAVAYLYKYLGQTENIRHEEISGDPDHYLVFYKKEDPNEPELSGWAELYSRPLPEEAVTTFKEKLRSLLAPSAAQDREGFHLVEHILLRPDDYRDDPLLQLPLGCDPLETPRDPYSFWLTVLLPNWTGRFNYPDFRVFVEQTFRREAPAHLALRFCWLNREQVLAFEPLFEAWLEAKARCQPNDCDVTDKANDLITWMNSTTCSCTCSEEEETAPCAAPPASAVSGPVASNAYPKS